MRRLLLALIFLLSCSRPGLQAARVNVSIPAIHVALSGTAFAVRDLEGRTRLLTAGHVCEAALAGNASITLTFGVVGGTATGGEYQVRAISLLSDLCEIEELVPSGQRLDVLDLAPSLPASGSRLLVVGAPYGVYPVRSEGVAIGWASVEKRPFLVGASPTVGPGNSGSPVMNEDGEVVGVLVMGGAFFFYAVPTAQVVEFLEAT